MRKTATLLLIAVLAAVLPTACRRYRSSSKDMTSSQTATMAPAQGPPAATGTEALTQTVDVEDGRSEDEGGALVHPKPEVKVPSEAKKPEPKKPEPVKKNARKGRQ